MEFKPQSILVYVGLDRVGDSLLKLPFIQGLRRAFPDAHITWLAGKDTSVYASFMAPAIDGLLDEVIDKAGIGLSLKELFRKPLNGRGFDLIIDTQRVALATFSVYRIQHKAFISPFGRFSLSTRKPPKGYVFPKSMLRQMLDLLELATGDPLPTPTSIELQVDEALTEAALHALPQGPTYIGLAPGAGGLPKCWPLDNFIRLARAQAIMGRTPVFILGPKELSWLGEIRKAVPDALFPLQANGLGENHNYVPQLTIALSGRLALSVCNDSGTGHMCALGGRPLISLFGRTVPEKFTPMTPRLTIIRAQDYGGRELDLIPLDAVEEAVETLLS